MTAPSPYVAPWFLCITIGFMSGIFLLLGYNTHICGGLMNGTFWTLAYAAFIWFIPLTYTGAMLMGMGAIAALVRKVSRYPAVGPRIELAAFIAPVASVLAGKAFAWAIAAKGVCELGKWT